MMPTVLIVDDEKNIRSTLATTFTLDGYDVESADDGEHVVDLVERGGIDLVLLDLQMPKVDGIEALRRLRKRGHRLPVIFLTAHGTIEKAVEAVRLGAFDFIEKPPHAEAILLSARNALRQSDLEEENRELRDRAGVYDEMIGSSPPMKNLFEQITRTAPTQARVLIVGENGTGKELIARALHRNSSRADGPFVRVNCAAIPRELFESELFGHERGAFTGATARRKGKFQRAHRGTLFLDEVGEIPPALQAKLLRALESGEVEPVGSDREVNVDARVIAATNKDLDRAVADGEFRRDLYYRLQVVTLSAPPLRERLDDLPDLARHFLEHACVEHNLPRKKLNADALDRLKGHAFPGNVRELRNVIERMVILAPGDEIDAAAAEISLPAPGGGDDGAIALRGSLRDTLIDVERRVVRQTLERSGWRMTAAAEQLGLERSHLYKKLKALGIEKPE
ncbi:MAG: sigma-54-dependent Fis family transcriptional regulator [bacterium]|nr:sigma-54-dependent Fis family transcriptional regulator [bacterium]